MAPVDIAQFYFTAFGTARRHRRASATREQAAQAALQEARRVLTPGAFAAALHALGGTEALVARLAQALANEEEDRPWASPSPT